MFAIKQSHLTHASRLSSLLAMMLIAGCGSDYTAPTAPEPVAQVTVTSSQTLAYVGFTHQLTAATFDEHGVPLTGRSVTWSTSDASKAIVSSNGMVTGIATGYATITATSEGRQGSVELQVFKIDIDSVAVTPLVATTARGSTQQLTAKAYTRTGLVLPGQPITWSSSDISKATVSPSGLVTGIAVGSVTITATTDNRSATATISVVP